MEGQLRHRLNGVVVEEPGGWPDFTEEIERNLEDRIIHLKYSNSLLFIGDGYDLLRLFREQPTLRQVPVLAVTADAMPHDVDRGREAGFDEYLTKPLDTGALQRALQRHLR